MRFMLVLNSEEYYVLSKFTALSRYFTQRSILVIFTSFTSFFACGQKFPASLIPDSLKENASMVIRLEERFYEIKSNNQAISHERHVYTILNEKGDQYATYRTYYNNKSVFINSVTGYLYDAAGKELRHFKKKDMEDHPVNDGSSFVSDERFKVGSLYDHTYPYTVDFEEEDELTELIHIGDWYPQSSLMHSVEKSTYRITAPQDYSIRYKMLNSSLVPDIEIKDKKKTYTWEMNNLVALEESPYSNELTYVPHLMIGLSEVAMGGYWGSMNTWNDYAAFYGSLQKGRDVLPEETKQKVHELTKGLTSPQAKVVVLYHYLQENSHYVGIQLGIGGWQTYDAAYVAKNKYGDCKALSNYMISLLKEAGITGHAVVIKGGREYVDFVTDFTHDPFNHVICCVPLEKDTIWLECTDQFLPPGYLSNFTSNRYGLLIDENGGSLVHTPAYLLADNVQSRKITAVLDKDGNLNLVAKTAYKAFCQDHLEGIIHHESREDQLTRLKSEFNLPTYEVVSFNYVEDYSSRLPVIRETLKLKINNYAQVTGRRIFINPDILTRSSEKLEEDKSRRLDIELREEYRHMDSVQITIPSGYDVESISKNQETASKFGKYKSSTVVSADQIIYTRTREQFSGRFSPKEYSEMIKFYNGVYEADHSNIVLVRKN
jgi:transglutaminase-like putative cysteine protease